MADPKGLAGELAEVAAQVQNGDVRAAKRLMRNAIAGADQQSLRVLQWCTGVLESYPYETAVARLRNAWTHRASAGERDLIAAIVAVAPQLDDVHRRAIADAVPPPFNRDVTYRPAPRRDSSAWRDDHRRTIDPARRQDSRTAREIRGDEMARSYAEERLGVAEGAQLRDRDERARDAQPYASNIDYDFAGVPEIRGLPCVCCRLERATADTATDRVRSGHGDDGLCGTCRENGEVGIPLLPVGHTVQDAIDARCDVILERHGRATRNLLVAEWRGAPPNSAVRSAIATWAEHNLSPRDATSRAAADQASRAGTPPPTPAASREPAPIEVGPGARQDSAAEPGQGHQDTVSNEANPTAGPPVTRLAVPASPVLTPVPAASLPPIVVDDGPLAVPLVIRVSAAAQEIATRYFEDAVSGDPVEDARLGAALDEAGRHLLVTDPKNAVATLDAAVDSLFHAATTVDSPGERQDAVRSWRVVRLLREQVGSAAADHASVVQSRHSRQQRDLDKVVGTWHRTRADEYTETQDDIERRAAADRQKHDQGAAEHRGVSADVGGGGLTHG